MRGEVAGTKRRDLIDLVERVADGDDRAAEELVIACHQDLSGFLRRRHASDPDGQANEILARFVRRLPVLEFTHPGQIWAYLYRMCRSSLAAFAPAGVEVPVGLEFSDEFDEEPLAESVETQFVVAEVLDGLTASQTQVLRLRFLRGLTVAETAAAMGISVNAVKALQYRALRSARQILALLAAVAAVVATGWVLLDWAASDSLSTEPVFERPERPERSEPSPDVDADESGAPHSEVPAGNGLSITAIDTPIADNAVSTTVPRFELDDDDHAATLIDRFDAGPQPPIGGFVQLRVGETIGSWLIVEPVSLDHAAHHDDDAVGQYLDLDQDGTVVRTIDGLEPGRTYEVVITAAIHSRITAATAVVEVEKQRTVIAPTTSAAVGFDSFTIPFEAGPAPTEIELSGLTSSAAWGGVVVRDVEVRAAERAVTPDRPAIVIDGFEDGAAAPTGGWIDYGSGDRFGAWTVRAGTVSRDHTVHHDPDAAPGHLLDLDSAGAVERTIDGLEPGRRYVLILRAGHHRGAPAASAQATIDGVAITFFPTTALAEGLQRFEIEFVASAQQVTLRLVAVDGVATTGVVIDEVRIDSVDR